MILTTRRKIALAAMVSRRVLAARRVCGIGPVCRVRRRGIEWELDLREGIDFAIWLTGQFEAATAAACRRLISADCVVVDIGANMGAHALPFARAVGDGGKVYAIEPTQTAYARLSRNIAHNPLLRDRIEAIQAMMVANDAQKLEPRIFSSWPLDASGERNKHPVHLGVAQSTSGACATTLDSLLSARAVSRLDLIKLDVDGFELDVLAGAEASLKRFRPKIVMEVAPHVMADRGHAPDAAVDLLRRHGYAFHTLSGRGMDGELDRLIARIPHGASMNLLALPV